MSVAPGCNIQHDCGHLSTKKVPAEALEASPRRLSRYTHVSTQLFHIILSVSSIDGDQMTTSKQGPIPSGRRVVELWRRLIAYNLVNARCGKGLGATQPQLLDKNFKVTLIAFVLPAGAGSTDNPV